MVSTVYCVKLSNHCCTSKTNFYTSLKELLYIETGNKLRDISCLWIERLNILRMFLDF